MVWDVLTLTGLFINLALTALLLLSESRRKLVLEVLRESRKGAVTVIALLTRENKELGISISEGGLYSFDEKVAEELSNRGWAKRL